MNVSYWVFTNPNCYCTVSQVLFIVRLKNMSDTGWWKVSTSCVLIPPCETSYASLGSNLLFEESETDANLIEYENIFSSPSACTYACDFAFQSRESVKKGDDGMKESCMKAEGMGVGLLWHSGFLFLAGWTGLHCEDDINECLLQPCNQGMCIRNEPGHGYTCFCRPGFVVSLAKYPRSPSLLPELFIFPWGDLRGIQSCLSSICHTFRYCNGL